MPRQDKSAETGKLKHQAGAIAKGHEKQHVARPEAETRAWAAANKLHSGGKEMASRRKLPSGPLGGSGRKTNVSRSS
jgi:hypothetical protein